MKLTPEFTIVPDRGNANKATIIDAFARAKGGHGPPACAWFTVAQGTRPVGFIPTMLEYKDSGGDVLSMEGMIDDWMGESAGPGRVEYDLASNSGVIRRED
jgi:hypothetical protein